MNWIGLHTMLKREIRRTFRVAIQTLVAPIISATLYIFIFGVVIGTQIETVLGIPYISFVFPGILMLSVINASFSSASSSLYFMRFTKGIEEILIAPFSYFEMLIGFLSGALFRAFLVASLITVVGYLFGAVVLEFPVLFFISIMGIAGIFALLGIVVALWSESFEQLQVLNTFVITPLTYLGGIFYSITFLPELAATLTLSNPFFYFANTVRYAIVGVSEVSVILGLTIIGVLFLLSFLMVLYLLKIGWKIRN